MSLPLGVPGQPLLAHVTARAFAVEYGCLGLVAGLGGAATGALTAWIVLRFVFDVPPALEAAPVAVALLGA